MEYYIFKSYPLKFSSFSIFEIFCKEKNCFFLDSSLNHGVAGRYSYLGIDPVFVVKTKGQDPFMTMREKLNSYAFCAPPAGGIQFFAGAVGYLAYDLGFILEKKIKKKYKPDLGIPDCFFGFYNTIVIIDHHKSVLSIFSTGYPEKKYIPAKIMAESNFKKMYNLLSKIASVAKSGDKPKIKKTPVELEPNFTKTEYIKAIQSAKEYIKNGDIYQVNLAQQFMAKSPLSSFHIYARLRGISPSYFSAYFDAGDFQIISSSPERFLKVQGNKVTTRPMKGTRGRSPNRREDQKLKKGLLLSPKDKAELMMIVDLERNDLGRVCRYGTINVPILRELEEYYTVYQTTATVEGKLHPDKDRLDLLRACFPGGSIVGCPKIRAMEIIEELEPARRSIYTGCLGYLSFSGNMDFNILIRSILKKGDKLYFGAGGGIVADSRAEDEYEETMIKAKAMMQAINVRGYSGS